MDLTTTIFSLPLLLTVLRGVRGDVFPSTETVSNTVAPVAGGVVGAIVVLAVIIVLLVVCVRQRSRQKATEQRRPEVEAESHFNPPMEEDPCDPHYSTAEEVAPAAKRMPSNTPSTTVASPSSQARLLNEMFSESSSHYELVDEMPQNHGRVSNIPVAGSASMTPATKDTQPQKSTGDEYAVVNKPKGKKLAKTPPAKLPKPKGLSTSSKAAGATAAATDSGELYANVDKSRSKGGNAKKKSDPPAQAEGPTSAGLTYASVEEVKSAAGPPARMVPETEYTTIDHVATAYLASDT